ncbi:MAG: bifunctional folylpolyglutamate synthase/dihydrofolate synthase [Lachnospiraceae bacterium]
MNFAEAYHFHETCKGAGSKLGLTRIKKLMEELGRIDDELAVIHVAGTNGKGSVCNYISEILRNSGYKVGLFSSPVVFQEREAFQINGDMVTEESYARVMTQVKAACENLTANGVEHPTSFEVDTAFALLYFYQEHCDFVILETGLGGRTDATNVVRSTILSILTSISLDHMDYLGFFLKDIARAKAGIIKPGVPVISTWQTEEIKQELLTEARYNGSAFIEAEPLCFYQDDQSFHYRDFGELALGSRALYQRENAALALEAADLLLAMGYRISAESVKRAMRSPGPPGRMEKISEDPPFFLDGAHNEAAAEVLAKSLLCYDGTAEWIMIIGVMKDKAYDKMLEKLSPVVSQIYTVTPGHERALEAKVLANIVRESSDISVLWEPSVSKAVQDARNQAVFGNRDGANMKIIACGSLYLLSEVKSAVYEIERGKSRTTSE